MPGFIEFKQWFLDNFEGRQGQASQLLSNALRNAQTPQQLEAIVEQVIKQQGLIQERAAREEKNLGVLSQQFRSLEDAYNSADFAVRKLVELKVEGKLNEIEATERLAAMYLKNGQLLGDMISKTKELIAQLMLPVTDKQLDELSMVYGQQADIWDAAFAAGLDLKKVQPETMIDEERAATDRKKKIADRMTDLRGEERGLPERLKKRKDELLGPETD